MGDFSTFLVKKYQHWQVKVHSNQGYLGRCLVLGKRKGALDLTDATVDEREELFMILKKLREATAKAFQPDWFNYAFLGNEERHLHGHFIPRYASPRQFANLTFTDPRWGQNYQTDKNFITPPEVLEAVRIKLKDVVG